MIWNRLGNGEARVGTNTSRSRWTNPYLMVGVLACAHLLGLQSVLYAQVIVSDRNITSTEMFSSEEELFLGPNILIGNSGEAILVAPVVHIRGPLRILRGGSLYVSHVTNISTEQNPAHLSFGISVDQNYPNPFIASTEIGYRLSSEGHVEIAVYNILGQKVATLLSRSQVPGFHTVLWDGKLDSGDSASSGIYYYRVAFGEYIISKKMTLLR